MPPELSIDAVVATALVRCLRAHAPREFVGLLGGTRLAGTSAGGRWRVGHVVPLPNVAAGDGSFAVDAFAFLVAEAQLRQQGLDWLGFVHSHPGSPATPSAQDRRQLWRGCVQLIVGERLGEIELRAFWLADATVQELCCVPSAAAGCP
jgi:proteasome lid subunit RPN8/RPN11